MRLSTTMQLARREAAEARRARWFWLAAASFLVLSLGLAWLGLAGAERSGLAGFDRTTAGLLNLSFLFVPLVGLALGGLGLAGDLEDGTLGLVLSQPVSRAEVFAGKFLGQAAALGTAMLAGFGATGLLVGLGAGGDRVLPFLALLGISALLGAAMLALGAALSAALGTRSRVIGAAFSAWLVLVYLSDLGTIGLAVARNLEPGQVFLLALLNPVHQARILGTMALTDRLELLGPAAAFGLDHLGAAGLGLVLASCLALTAGAALAVGYLFFREAVVP